MSFRRCLSVAGVGLLAGGSLLVLTGPRAEAQSGSGSALVTDYANYPDTLEAQLPAGCDGGGLFHSELFSLNGGPAVPDPHSLPEFKAGDDVTMTWDATTEACVGAPVVLTVKVAQDPVFDPGDDQFAYVPYAVTTADGGPGNLTYTLPDLSSFGFGCAYQFDAIVGVPLAVVGPHGSDYSSSVRGDDRRTTLIAYRNGAFENCAPVETTTTSTPETTTTTGATTTTESSTSTTEAPTTTVAATPSSTTAVLVAAPVDAAPPAVEAASAQRTLATTGRSSGWLVVAGLVALNAGSLALVAARRRLV